MPLKDQVRTWLGAASDNIQQDALGALRGEIARVEALVEDLRNRHEAAEARHEGELGRLRDDLSALAGTSGAYATADELSALARRIEDGEQLRLRIAGLAEQLRWESDDLRKALAAIAERVERKPA